MRDFMNIKYIVVMMLLLPKGLVAQEDKIIEAIKNSDPRSLGQLLMPGFYIGREDKKRYLELAKEVTNKTYTEQYHASMGDFVRHGLNAGIKGGLAYTIYESIKNVSYRDSEKKITLTHLKGMLNWNDDGLIKPALLAVVAIGLGLSALSHIKKFLSKRESYKRHRNALAVEAIISRLPACENGYSGPTFLP